MLKFTHLSLICLVMITISFKTYSKVYSLKEVLKFTRGNSITLKEQTATQNSLKKEVIALEGVYDFQLSFDSTYSYNSIDSSSALSGDNQTLIGTSLGFSKLFSSGTAVNLVFDYEKTKIGFDTAAKEAAVSPYITYNPSFERSYTLSMSQSLWKNLMSKQVKLSQSIINNAVNSVDLQKQIENQEKQYQAERLFWNYMLLNNQVNYMNQLIEKSKKFLTLIEKRKSIGRADEVEVVESQSTLVGYEQNLLSLKMNRLEFKKNLINLMNLNKNSEYQEISADFYDKSFRGTTYVNYRRKSLNKDLKTLNKNLKMMLLNKEDMKFDLEKELNYEKTKSSFDFVAALKSGDLQGSGEDLISGLSNFKDQYSYSVGVKWVLPIGSTQRNATKQSLNYKKMSLANKKLLYKNELKKNLYMLYEKLKIMNLQVEQSKKQIKLMKLKRDKEKTKAAQARSEQIFVLRYEMELLSMKIEQMNILTNLKLQGAFLKYLKDSYVQI
jgi:hypothetical protein